MLLDAFETFVTSLIPSLLLSPEAAIVLEVVYILVCVLIFLMHMYVFRALQNTVLCMW